ncbi:MAG TPA: hypothetical protein HA364_09530 [Thermoplasmata archaeon]|nr:hypothetical protein [Thermoplasmata archaeon]
MPALKDEIDKVIELSSRNLLRVAPPPVRYWLLWDMLQGPSEDPRFLAAAEECKTYLPRLRLLAGLGEDGTWPISRTRKMAEDAGPGPPYGWTYITMLRNLDALGDSRTTKDEGHVSAAVERILGWQTKEGYIPGPWERFPLPQYNGYALRNLAVLGMGSDPRVHRIERWLLDMQRGDGGWVIPYIQDIRYLPQYKNMKMREFTRIVNQGQVPYTEDRALDDIPSCIWTTMMVVRGLVAGQIAKTDKRLLSGAELFLDGFFKENYHTTFFKEKGHWTKLKYPTYFGSGLCALDLLTFLGFGPGDERMDKPIRWLLGARSKDGFWSRSDRPHPETDMWITEVALSSLIRYSRMY